MGLDDFDAAEFEEAQELRGWKAGAEDKDLFDFPEFDPHAAQRGARALVADGEPRAGDEELLADTLEAIEALADDALGDIDALAEAERSSAYAREHAATPAQAPAPARPKPTAPSSSPSTQTGSFDLDEDLFDFEELSANPLPAYAADLDAAADALPGPQIAATADPVLAKREPLAPPASPSGARTGKSASQRTAAAGAAAGIGALRPAALASAPRSGAGFSYAQHSSAEPTLSDEPRAPRKGLRGVPVLWLVVALCAFNALVLCAFWSSLAGMRELVHEVATTASGEGRLAVRAAPREPASPTVAALPAWDPLRSAGRFDPLPTERALPVERFLEAGEALLAEGQWAAARRELHALLAQIDSVDLAARADAEARANFLVAESLRLEAKTRGNVEAGR